VSTLVLVGLEVLSCRVADVEHFNDPFFDSEQDSVRPALLPIEELGRMVSSKASFSGASVHLSGWVLRLAMVSSSLSSHRLAASGDSLQYQR
jgi:hypothetical protein